MGQGVIILHWFNILRTFSIIGAVCSIFITVLYFILFWLLLKNPKTQSKIVGETSLEKYLSVIIIGIILASIFGIILMFT